MRLLMLIALLCVGYGAWKFYEGRIDSELDYKTMDARGISHEWIETPYQLCIRGHEAQESVRKLCICHANGMLHSLTKEEFIQINKDLMTRTPSSPDIDAKIKKSATDCRIKYNGS